MLKCGISYYYNSNQSEHRRPFFKRRLASKFHLKQLHKTRLHLLMSVFRPLNQRGGQAGPTRKNKKPWRPLFGSINRCGTVAFGAAHQINGSVMCMLSVRAGLGFTAFPTVRSVINRLRAVYSLLWRADRVWRLMRLREAWKDEMESSLYLCVMAGILNMSRHLQNCFQLLQMLQVQWMVMDDKDNGYLKVLMMPFMFLWFRWIRSAFWYWRLGTLYGAQVVAN